MAEQLVKAGTVELADGSSVDYEEVGGERVAWVTSLHFKTCGHSTTAPRADLVKAAGFARMRRVGFADFAGRCSACVADRRGAAAGQRVATVVDADLKKAEAAAAAPEPPKYRQNVKTDLKCPECGAGLLIMTRKADGRRFLACSAFYGPAHCGYTSNTVPQHLLAAEAGVPMLPLPGLG